MSDHDEPTALRRSARRISGFVLLVLAIVAGLAAVFGGRGDPTATGGPPRAPADWTEGPGFAPARR